MALLKLIDKDFQNYFIFVFQAQLSASVFLALEKQEPTQVSILILYLADKHN